ncbi:MAG: hypothetical protein SF162_01210 [bacterium]|nr:hypothetical protein [bacterium]
MAQPQARRLRPLLYPLFISTFIGLTLPALANPTSPAPPAGYAYGTQTVNRSSFDQSLGSEIVANSDFSSWSGNNPVGWTTTESGSNVVSESAQNGSPGTGAARFTSSASLSPQISQNTSSTVGTWYEVTFNVSAFTNGQFRTNFLGSSNVIIGGAGRQYYLHRAASASIQVTTNGTVTHDFVLDDYSARPISWASTSTATSDATHTLSFTLPASPQSGHSIWLIYRLQDQANFWAARLQRSGSNWNASLVSMSAGTLTTHINAFSVGTIDSLRVMAVGNDHLFWTGSGGTFTQRGGTITSVAHAAQSGLTTLYNSGFTPSLLQSYSIVQPTPTPAVTNTATSTPVPSNTPTATPTPDVWVYWTLQPPASGTPGQVVAYAYQITTGGISISILLAAIFVSLLLMFIILISR